MALGKKDEKGNAVTTGTQVLAIGMVGMDASGGSVPAKIVTGSAITHVLSRHTAEGALNAGASIFSREVDILALIKKAESLTPELQTGGNFQRVITSAENIEIDRATGTFTKVYTVITDAAGNLITAFPGRP